MIKVLVIVNAVFGYDGISNVATNYYMYQDKKQIYMDFATINPVNDKLQQTLATNKNKNYVLSYRNKNPLRYVIELTKIIKNGNYDIVHVHGNSATMAIELLAARLAGCKVRIAHSHNISCDHKTVNKILMPMFAVLYTHCCACSVEAGRFLFGDKPCKVVNNGIYFPNYVFNEVTRSTIRKSLGYADSDFVLGHIGRFAYQKNQEFILELLKNIKDVAPDTKLLLVGEGELMSKMKTNAEKLQIASDVCFYGTTDCVWEVVQAMDVFVFPSRFEGLGIVAIEAQASGLACVASDAVPQKAKVLDDTVFLPLSNVNAWTNAIIQARKTILERKDTTDEVRNRLIEHHFDIEKNCEDMLGYYKSLVEGSSK